MNLFIVLLAATLYQVEPVNGSVTFNITKWGVIREEGTFRKFRAQIVYDDKAVAQSRVAFEVDASTIDTKNSDRDSTLRSEDFFHVAKHPKLTFRSTAVAPRGANLADVTGDLTIRGVTRRITVPVRFLGARDRYAGFETTFTIDRRKFGVTGGRWSAGAAPGVLANDVTIRIVAGGVKR